MINAKAVQVAFVIELTGIQWRIYGIDSPAKLPSLTVIKWFLGAVFRNGQKQMSVGALTVTFLYLYGVAIVISSRAKPLLQYKFKVVLAFGCNELTVVFFRQLLVNFP